MESVMHLNALSYPDRHETSFHPLYGCGRPSMENLSVTLLFLAGAMQVGAQTKRCDLVGRDTVI